MSAIRPSFERIDYSIRANKNIERKLVFERLGRLAGAFGFDQYRYMGFGSMWFVDFVLAHRLLRIQTMWSFEEADPERADFNRPHSCIDVRPGSSSASLAVMSATDWNCRFIAWFDYDGPFTEDTRTDCQTLVQNLSAGSILLISVNAWRRMYKQAGPADVGPSVLERLKSLFGQSVEWSGPAADVGDAEFPSVLRKALLALLAGSLLQTGRIDGGDPLLFVPLFDFLHIDGAPVATVGGMIAGPKELTMLESTLGGSRADIAAGAAVLRETLDIVPITPKEKIALDGLLPCSGADFPARLNVSGVRLPPAQADKYRRLYNYYPLFVETLF